MNIESALRKKPGLSFVKVRLDEKLGTFRHDPQLLNGQQLAESIADMGYDTKIRDSHEILHLDVEDLVYVNA